MEHDKDKRTEERVPYKCPVCFTVLSMRGSEFQRIRSMGTIVDASKTGVELMTPFPLQPGQVLHWDDRHRESRLHIALVKWSRKRGDHYNAGLMFI
jgi:hypothetical protein